MAVYLSKTKTSNILLFLSVLVLLLNSYELTFLVWSFTALFSLQNTYSLKITKLILILSIVLVVAFFSSFFHVHKGYNFFRDVAYLLKPILGLLIGYNVCKIVGKKTIRIIVYSGVSLAIIHIITLIICFTFFAIRNISDLRHYGGYFDDLEIYVLILLLFRDKFNLELSRQKAYLFIFIVAFSSFLYLARTNIIQLVILIVAIKGHFTITKKSLTIISLTIIGVLLSYTAIYYSHPNRSGKGLEAFLYKIKIAPIEAFKTKIDQDDWKEFNDNYRSFENISTVKQVYGNGWFSTTFGKGLGSTVDIGREMWTNDGEFIRYIPTLHNAYMTMFLKSGLIGVFLCFWFIYVLFKNEKATDKTVININYLLVGSALFLILSNWVFMGVYLKLDNKSIFLGFLLCYKELFLKEKNQIVQNAE
jgi:hypothetical protein